MDFNHELVTHQNIIPAKILIQDIKGSNCYIPKHWHKEIEINLIMRGEHKYYINGKEGCSGEGELTFFNSGDIHSVDVTNQELGTYTVTILISYDYIKNYYEDLDNVYFNIHSNIEVKDQICEIMKKINKLYLEKKPFYEINVVSCINDICYLLLSQCIEEKKLNGNILENQYLYRVKLAMEYTENNYFREITLDEISKYLHLSQSYFCRYFKKATGKNYYSYLTSVRLYHSFVELTNTKNLISEIALNNGFPNVKSFINNFKKIHGLTPNNYRNNL